jgi:hypothetical protein
MNVKREILHKEKRENHESKFERADTCGPGDKSETRRGSSPSAIDSLIACSTNKKRE